MPTVSHLARALGAGLVAGLAGTAAITATRTLQRAAQGQPLLDKTPAMAVAGLLGIRGEDPRANAVLAMKTHLEYGAAWGLFRGLAEACGLHGAAATAAHVVALDAAAMALLPAAGVAPPLREWKLLQTIGDTAHHAVYAAVAGAVWKAMTHGSHPIALGRRRPERARRPYARLPQHDDVSAREPELALVGGELA